MNIVDAYIEREEAQRRRRAEVAAKAAGRFVEFMPPTERMSHNAASCPSCGAPVTLSGNMAFCRAVRACGWQGLNHAAQTDRHFTQLENHLSVSRSDLAERASA